jgi:CRP/FNR family transcriptional regulator, cyclic AMP receptor protein
MPDRSSAIAQSATQVASLLDLDPDLGKGIPAADWPNARRATAAPLLQLPQGPTDVAERLAEHREFAGGLIADGILLREVALGERAVPELLGVGDIMSPRVELEGPLPCEVALTALAPTRVLVLGAGFARAVGRWPVLLGAVERRRAAQRDRLAVLGALTQLPRVELRLLTLLWHLSSAWGRVGAEGVVVPFALTHEMLGRFVGAQRPTVTLAARQLEEDGLVRRGSDGGWVLLPESEEALVRTLGPAPSGPSVLARARATHGTAESRQDGHAPQHGRRVVQDLSER